MLISGSSSLGCIAGAGARCEVNVDAVVPAADEAEVGIEVDEDGTVTT